MATPQSDETNSPIVNLKDACRDYDPGTNENHAAAMFILQQYLSYPMEREFDQRWNEMDIVLDPMLQLNSEGIAVVQLQQLLNRAGATLVVDGQFGPKSQAAVLEFQRSNLSFTVDGIVDDQIWYALRNYDFQLLIDEKFSRYNPTQYPAQNAALDWLQAQIPMPVLIEFSTCWRMPPPYDQNAQDRQDWVEGRV